MGRTYSPGPQPVLKIGARESHPFELKRFMSEESKSIWKKSFRGRTALVVWLVVAAFAVALAGFIYSLSNPNQPVSGLLHGMSLVAIGLLAAILLAAILLLVYLV